MRAKCMAKLLFFSCDYHKLAFQNKKAARLSNAAFICSVEKSLNQFIESFFKVLDKLVFKRINQGKP